MGLGFVKAHILSQEAQEKFNVQRMYESQGNGLIEKEINSCTS